MRDDLLKRQISQALAGIQDRLARMVAHGGCRTLVVGIWRAGPGFVFPELAKGLSSVSRA